MTKETESYVLKKSESWQMFNEISPKYDFLNRMLSFGLDVRWRKKLASYLPNKESLNILDLATGTADVLLTICRLNQNIEHAYGIDKAEKMLEIGESKVKKQNLSDKITLQHGDATHIPFMDEKFDAITISFGIRNVEDPSKVLREMRRTLNAGGKGFILEFSIPQNPIIRAGHLFYLRQIVPFLGGLFAGNYKAYKYLNQTIEKFPYGDDFCTLMENEGFRNIQIHPLLFGVASIYEGQK